MSENEGNNRRRRRPFRREGRPKEDFRGNDSSRTERRGMDPAVNQEGKARGSSWRTGSRNQDKRPGGRSREEFRYYKKAALYDRPRWVPPRLNTEPLPTLDCGLCGRPIVDMHSALTDKRTGKPVHFDCVITELMEQETPEQGDVVSYIGGGRFGIVHFNEPAEKREKGAFTIKKILEWEDKENRAEWRGFIADHYSVT